MTALEFREPLLLLLAALAIPLYLLARRPPGRVIYSSMALMPAGVPVGTLAIGRAGAVNAALLAAAILALGDETIADALRTFRAEQSAATVELPGD